MTHSSEERHNVSCCHAVAQKSAAMDEVPSRSAITTILERDQRLVYKGNGTSMLPMLRSDRDMVVFVPVKERLKKYDIALYMRGNKYIAHRVIKVQESGYLIRGDNTYAMENVSEEDVIGVLTHFVRNGKQYHVYHKGYRMYSWLWCALFPVRLALRKGIIWAKRLLRKLGLTPFIKRILKI